MSRRRTPVKPRAANSCSAASRSRSLVAAELRGSRGPLDAGGWALGGWVLCGGIPALEVEHAKLFEPLANAGREQPEPLHVGHDLAEEHLPEHLHRLALERDLEALGHGHAHALPDFLHEEAIAHQARGLEDEVLAILELGAAHVVVDALEREHAEGHVARL